MIRATAYLMLMLASLGAAAQSRTAQVSGMVTGINDEPLSGVSVIILGKNKGVSTGDSGRFMIEVPAEKACALVFTFAGYHSSQKNFFLSPGESEEISVQLTESGKTLETVVIGDQRERKENSLVKINPRNAVVLPGPSGGVEGLIKTLVGSNNELTSQYSVRGGNFDENLVYINDIEVFRPYLVSNAQQEGLSLINPELAKSVSFYSGGFQAKYGDKISSVLDIQYKRPGSFGGSAYLSLLEQGLHLEGSSRDGKLTYIFGARNKTSQNVLRSQPIQGAYLPSSSDIQAFVTGRLSEKWQWEMLGIFSSTRFDFIPQEVRKTASVFSPLYTSNLALDIYFEGQERDKYSTGLSALTVTHTLKKNLRMKWTLSRFTDREKENFDIGGAYLFGERDYDNSSNTYGQIINPLGTGYDQQYARNRLDITVWNLGYRGYWEKNRHYVQWGLLADRTRINDRLAQWEYRDSAGYSLPYDPGTLRLFISQQSNALLDITKLSGYIQDNWRPAGNNEDLTIQAGLRFHYNTLNRQWLFSPRASVSWSPGGNNDLILKAAAGVYDQPPFYRELRGYDGQLNTSILAQRSLQFVAGADYNFSRSGKPFRLTSEIYYKRLRDVIPYDIDNVKIRYLGNNNAKAYALGAELRLFGQLVKDAESWLSVGVMKTMEDLEGDHYYRYLNAEGEEIGPNTEDKVVADSARYEVGWLRRPSDRRFTIGLFLQDYLATNKNFRVHLNMLYGSNMPYNIPNSVRYRNALIIDPYIRVDIGFSVRLMDAQQLPRSHSPFRHFENIWLSLEVFNLLNRANIISYQIVKDFAGNNFAIPNRLTPRLLNLKLAVRF